MRVTKGALPGSAVCGLALIAALPALMQEAAAQEAVEGLRLEEVVVTARRVEENLQTVPIAITAISGEAIKDAGIRTAFDLNKKVPGVSFCCYADNITNVSAGKPNVWVRGVQGIVAYFADVPVSLNQSSSYFDIGNVQMLKGPQGTLFGVATTGGALLFAPKRPTNSVEGHVEAGFGQRGRHEFEVVANVPVIDDKLLVRVGAQRYHSGGYIRDLLQGKKLNDRNLWTGRAQVLFRPDDRLENNLLVQHYRSDNNGNPTVMAASFNPSGLLALIYGRQRLQDFYDRQRALGWYAIENASDIPGGTYRRDRVWTAINTTTYDVSDSISLKNILGFQRSWFAEHSALAGTPFVIFGNGTPRLPDGTVKPPQPAAPVFNWTEEFQVNATLGDLTAVVGTFHQWTNPGGAGAISHAVNLGGAVTAGNGLGQTSRTNAVYGQATYDLSSLVLDGLKLTAGYRHTYDKRNNQAFSYNPVTLALLADRRQSDSWKSDSYTVSATYQVTDSAMLYATTSRGYSVGGFNTQGGIPDTLISYAPETLTNYEGGLKSQFNLGGMPVRANLSGYYAKYKDIQVAVVTNWTDPVTGTARSGSLSRNAASGHISGGEAEFTILPVRSLELGGAVAYTRAKYDRYSDDLGRDLSGTPFIGTPEWKYNLNATYHLPIDEALGDLALGLSWNWTKGYPMGAGTFPAVDRPNVGDTVPNHHKLDIDLRWSDMFGRKGLDGTVYVTNVTNTWKGPGNLPTYASLGLAGRVPEEPRTWGMRVRYSFE